MVIFLSPGHPVDLFWARLLWAVACYLSEALEANWHRNGGLGLQAGDFQSHKTQKVCVGVCGLRINYRPKLLHVAG